MNTELPYPPQMPQAPQPVFNAPAFGPNVLRYNTSHQSNEKEKGQKIKIAFYATVLFALLSHASAYRIMNMVYNAITSKPFELLSEQGAPTIKGVVIHSIIFFVALMILISKYG
jgi:hypothetical protein